MKDYYSLLKIFLYLIFAYLLLTIVQGLGQNPAIRAIGLIAGTLTLVYFVPKLMRKFDEIPYFKNNSILEEKKEKVIEKLETNTKEDSEINNWLTSKMDYLTKNTDAFRIFIKKNIIAIIVLVFIFSIAFRVIYLVIFKHIPISAIIF
jgi:ABC-type transport system involved in cytochrome bd biosynthesis fused ATPase/permease subunit